MIVEFVAGSDDVTEIRDRETREIKGLKQQCYFHLADSAFPVRGKIRVSERYNPGKYRLNPSFKVGKFGDLEVNPFEDADLTPYQKPASAVAAK